MGSPESEKARYHDEARHQVTMSDSAWLFPQGSKGGIGLSARQCAISQWIWNGGTGSGDEREGAL